MPREFGLQQIRATKITRGLCRKAFSDAAFARVSRHDLVFRLAKNKAWVHASAVTQAAEPRETRTDADLTRHLPQPGLSAAATVA